MMMSQNCLFRTNPTIDAENLKPLNEETKKAIVEALMDEYKAYSFYAAVMQKFGDVMPFRNIIHSEARHANRLHTLMNAYKMEIPENPYLGKLEAPETLEEACQMGIDSEIENLEMYDGFFPFVEDETIRETFQALRDASEFRHLPAFERFKAFYTN